MTKDDDDSKITAVQKAARLLQSIASAEEPTSLAELADQTAMPKPSVHRLLLQLEHVGFVQRDLSGTAFEGIGKNNRG